jgi:hypothetical protein
VLGAGFEIRNVVDHLLRLAGHPAPTPFVLGSLGRGWTSVARGRTPAEVRAALACSAWGDPGTDDPAGIRVALLVAWAAEVYATVPGAANWAKEGALLLMDRVRAAGAEELLAANTRRRLLHLVGSGQPTGAASGAEPWQREVLWLRNIQRESGKLASRPPRDPASVVGATGLLAADAWLTRAALGLAATGGADLDEVVGAAGW